MQRRIARLQRPWTHFAHGWRARTTVRSMELGKIGLVCAAEDTLPAGRALPAEAGGTDFAAAVRIGIQRKRAMTRQSGVDRGATAGEGCARSASSKYEISPALYRCRGGNNRCRHNRRCSRGCRTQRDASAWTYGPCWVDRLVRNTVPWVPLHKHLLIRIVCCRLANTHTIF